ncbi:MAG: trypsin-like serine protease [Bdellovibrionaceae bacterium]|nr:trypsin-like serine protease [Pseudobdellovibrionaceae bacterium]
MKTLTLILTLILAQQASACFDDVEVKALIEASQKLDECFKDGNDCNYENRDLEKQRVINSRRLIPVDRSKSPLLNIGTGKIEADLQIKDDKGNNQKYSATAERISRCHIITSAHLLYQGVDVSTERVNFDMKFKSGQTCDMNKHFEKSAPATLVFKMTDERRGDFKFGKDENGKVVRIFNPHNDLVIIKLNNKADYANKFFKLNTMNPADRTSKLRVNCWGYPGHNEYLKLSKEKSDMFLWHQTGALISNENTERGILTNAQAYNGMSGGGCSTSEKSDELVGLYSDGNRTRAQSTISIDANRTAEQGTNKLSGFHRLAERFAEANGGRSLESLDADCN